jgi:hypothetical protein
MADREYAGRMGFRIRLAPTTPKADCDKPAAGNSGKNRSTIFQDDFRSKIH